MNFRVFAAALAISVSLAPVAVSAQDQSLTFAQADFREPASFDDAVDSEINADSIEIALLKDVYVHVDRAMRDRLSGKLDSAAAEDKIAADTLVSFVNKYPNHRLRIVFMRMAAGRYLQAKEWELAAEAAQRMLADPKGLPVTKAIGARYASGAWQMLAVQEMRSGKIPQLKLQPSSARAGVAPSPRVPDRAWKMFVEAADIYEKNRDADPSSKLSAEERKAQGGADLGQLQLIAAQVEFGYDNIEDAQKRFGRVIEMHPSRGDLLETAVPYYLDSFRILKDPKGLEAAATRRSSRPWPPRPRRPPRPPPRRAPPRSRRRTPPRWPARHRAQGRLEGERLQQRRQPDGQGRRRLQGGEGRGRRAVPRVGGPLREVRVREQDQPGRLQRALQRRHRPRQGQGRQEGRRGPRAAREGLPGRQGRSPDPAAPRRQPGRVPASTPRR